MAKEKTPRTTTRTKKAAPEVQVAPETVASVPVAPQVIAPEVTRATVQKTIVTKPETKSNVIPINVEEQIRRRAYEISEQRGFLPGYEAEDWLAAEQEILGRYQTRTA